MSYLDKAKQLAGKAEEGNTLIVALACINVLLDIAETLHRIEALFNMPNNLDPDVWAKKE